MADDGKIHGSSIAEQLIAGALLIGVTVAVTHAYDTHKTARKRRKERAR